jgi:hypothetical protein
MLKISIICGNEAKTTEKSSEGHLEQKIVDEVKLGIVVPKLSTS